MSSNPLPLRPHHGMCMAYFIGCGYSDAFSAHMSRLLASLEPESLVRLVVGTDAVCAACPNNLGGVCEKPAQVAGYDRAVLDRCGLPEGAVLPFAAFTSLVQARVLGLGLRERICGGCQWAEICNSHPSRWAALPPSP